MDKTEHTPQGAGKAPTERRDAAAVPTPRIGRMLGGDARLAANDEPESGDLTHAEVDAIAADLSYNRAKNDGSLARRDEERALDAQVYRTNLLEHLR